jgi:hypothetical protein
VRSYRLWCRRDELAGGELVLRVAIRCELFAQVQADRRLVEMPPKTFALRAAAYQVGRSQADERPQGRRAILLDAEFVVDLLARPAEEPLGGVPQMD